MAQDTSMDKVFEVIEIAKASGKLKKGVNEVTKAIEKGKAKLVAIAKDVKPPEITMHIPLLSKEKGVLCYVVETKEELGSAAGVPVGCSAVAVIEEGNAKKVLEELRKLNG